MHANNISAEAVRFVLLRNRKGFRIIVGTYIDTDPDTVSFDYIDQHNGDRQRMTVARDMVAGVQGSVTA